MTRPASAKSRDQTRAQLVEVAARLLASGGPDAVTTRSVALAAGVQAPTIYRLFGDKSGLLDAVVEHGFASYMAGKAPVAAGADPVEGLRAGWDLHVGFGLANPELFRLLHMALRTPDGRAAAAAGVAVLRARVHRVAEAGWLRVTERRAVDVIHAAGTGVVFTLIDQAADERDEALAETAWESVCAAILTDAGQAAAGQAAAGQAAAGQAATGRAATGQATTSAAAAAVTLRAALPGLGAFSPAERALLADWLDRIAEARPALSGR